MTGRDDRQWQPMDANEELDLETADRLLAGDLGPADVGPSYRQVATLLAATRAEPSAAELARQAETVRAMAAARRNAGEAIGPSPVSVPTPLARRKDLRLGVLAAFTAASLTTGLAAAGVLPESVQPIATGALPSLGASSPNSEEHDTGGRSEPATDSEAGPGTSEGGEGVPEGPARPPGARAPGTQQAPNAAPGQAKQAARAVLQAEGAASGGRLVVSFHETGVGADAVTVTARADATATYGCVSQSGNSAEKVRKEARVQGVSEAGSRFSAVDGKAGGALTLTAPVPAGVSCPGGRAPQLLRVVYSRVIVLDVTTGASTSINRTFSTTA